MENELFFRILLTVVFGAILGLESETRLLESYKKQKKSKKENEKSTIGGVRTYTILALFGGVAGILFSTGESFLVYASFFGLIAFLVAAYIENVRIREAFGMTTEIAIMITFILGFLTTSGLVSIELILFILVILAFFLSQKRGVGVLLEKVTHTEIIDIFKFGVVALVILPILPNQVFFVRDLLLLFGIEEGTVSISDDLLNISIINPFRIWIVVVIVSGINLGSYLASKLIGSDKSILLTSVLGGFISSTSTTVALATRSKKASKSTSKSLAGAAVISNAISLISILILLLIIAPQISNLVSLPLLAMFVIGLLIGLLMLFNNSKTNHKIEIEYTPFSIGPAVKFVSIVVGLTILIQLLQLINIEELVLVVTALSGSLGLDAPTIAISELTNDQSILVETAAIIF